MPPGPLFCKDKQKKELPDARSSYHRRTVMRRHMGRPSLPGRMAGAGFGRNPYTLLVSRHGLERIAP